MTNSKVTIHMVASLDGFIATKSGDVSWMQSKDTFEEGAELTVAYIEEFLSRIDCYCMGARTYEQALHLGWPYGETPTFVLSHHILKNERPSVQFYAGNLRTLIEKQLRPNYQNIWMAGGADLTKQLLQEQLADELIVSIMPILLGGGKPFFDAIGREQLLHLKAATPYKDGMVELTYEIIKE